MTATDPETGQLSLVVGKLLSDLSPTSIQGTFFSVPSVSPEREVPK